MRRARAVAVGVLLIVAICLLEFALGCGKANRDTRGKRRFVNSVCPVHMDNRIEPDKVPMHRIREFNDRKIAFCGDECPPIWDKLGDPQKQAALIKAGTR